MVESNQRKAWIDILKGIAIIFIVLGHNPLTTLYPKTFNIIFSFHIPLFFFISGYLFNLNTAGRDLCKKRFKSLIRPYIFTAGIVSLIYILVKSSPSPLWYAFWFFYGNGPNLPKLVLHLWFLPCLFLVTLVTWSLFKIIDALKNSMVLQLLSIITFLTVGILGIHFFWNLKIPSFLTNWLTVDGNQFLVNGLLNNPAYLQERLSNDNQFILKGLPWSADIILIAVGFFVSGYFVKKNRLEFIFHKHVIALPMVALFFVLHFFYNYTIDLNLRRYDNLLICTLLAYAGINICNYAANLIAEKKNRITIVMQYIGQYSLIIFIFHPILQGKVYSLIIALTIPYAEYIAILTAFIAGISLPLLLNYLLLERLKLFRYWYHAK